MSTEIISKNLERKDKGVVMELRVDGARVLFHNDAYFGISREEQARRLEKARKVAEDIIYRAHLRMIERGEWDGKSPAPPLIAFESAAQDRARREKHENPDR